MKAWSEKSWKRELDANSGKHQLQGMTRRMIEQLQAAKQTGETVYLAVSDAIGVERIRLQTGTSALGK